MPALNYTHTLTAGQPENVNHVQQNFTDARTVVNALDDANFAATSGMYVTYGMPDRMSNYIPGNTAADTYLLGDVNTVRNATLVSGIPATYLDDADLTIAGRTPKLRLRAQTMTNATAPAITFTFGMYEVTACAGGANIINYTLGTVLAGSTVAFASPAASTRSQGNSGDFAFPGDGYYAFACVTSGVTAVNSRTNLQIQLQQRWV